MILLLAAVIINVAVVVEISVVVEFSKLEIIVVELLVMLISRFRVGYKVVSKTTQEVVDLIKFGGKYSPIKLTDSGDTLLGGGLVTP